MSHITFEAYLVDSGNSLIGAAVGQTMTFPLVYTQVEPEKLKTLTHDLEALDRAAKRGLK